MINWKKKIVNKIIKPTLEGLSELGTNYKGFLYTGLMIVNDEPYLIEYNVRMGDPECQTILPRLKTDISDIFLACCEQRLNNLNIIWSSEKSLCIVVCAKGYPDKYRKYLEIKNLNKINLDKNNFIFHAGTEKKDGRIYSVGGRVLNLISISDSFNKAKENIIKNLNTLNWSDGFYRKDIGYKVINK